MVKKIVKETRCLECGKICKSTKEYELYSKRPYCSEFCRLAKYKRLNLNI